MAINFPNSPSNGDTHIVNNITYTYDAVKDIWNISDQTAVTANLGSVGTDILPNATTTYNLGSDSLRWNHLYLNGNSLFLGEATISSTGTAVNLPAGSTVGGTAIGSGGGGISNVVEDTTPQLGGNLDLNGNDLVFTTSGGYPDVTVSSGVVTSGANGQSFFDINLPYGNGNGEYFRVNNNNIGDSFSVEMNENFSTGVVLKSTGLLTLAGPDGILLNNFEGKTIEQSSVTPTGNAVTYDCNTVNSGVFLINVGTLNNIDFTNVPSLTHREFTFSFWGISIAGPLTTVTINGGGSNTINWAGGSAPTFSSGFSRFNITIASIGGSTAQVFGEYIGY